MFSADTTTTGLITQHVLATIENTEKKCYISVWLNPWMQTHRYSGLNVLLSSLISKNKQFSGDTRLISYCAV